MKKQLALIFFLFFTVILLGVDELAWKNREHTPKTINKSMVDDYWHYTTVGQIGMTITNFGILGEGYNNPDQPSCMYKQYPDNIKQQIEHFSYAGIWVGGMVDGEKRVSTAVVDGVFDYAAEGFEYISVGDSVQERSSITTSPLYSPEAISHQDFITRFHDNKDVVNHVPLGIEIMLESYAWNYSFAEAFVILNYHIINKSTRPIENIYAGIWLDASVGNMNYTNIYEPGGGWQWYDNLNGYDQTIFDPVDYDDLPGIERDIAYQYDVDGDNGYAESYLGISVLGSSLPRAVWDTHYNQWPWTTSSDLLYPELVMPIDDDERYDKLSHTQGIYPGILNYTEEGFPDDPRSWMCLLSAGPFGQETTDSLNWTLNPGDTINVVFAVGAGLWANSSLVDNSDRRNLLQWNLDWAQKAYNGEDSNGNGFLDPGEDQNDDGKLQRYVLPVPPPSPKLHIVSSESKATLYWSNAPETFKDPISREEDFEGYRIYSRRKTSTVENAWTLLAQFDKINDFGYNTGYDYVQIKDELGNPSFVTFDGDTTKYYYKFENLGILNGWPEKNTYAITSYDTGDPDTGLEPLESSVLENDVDVIAGREANNDFSFKVGVYPNPYRTSASWDGSGVKDRLIWFTGLPAQSRIRIYTLAGELLKVIDHEASSYVGQGIDMLADKVQSFENDDIGLVLSGGEHAWDLISDYDQAIATGLYLFSVENKESGEIKTGRFLVIK